ncbi:hypothetical protein T12_6150 [Trichinella patagoniensis]|uniref:Uncharacterized protein n=1 Tax=Trichinella patagoniensis TaxID=990121 RepID=A0A0V0ZC84_9BILA|nr:hypothetical protein T12_6150 [Trichinella patagoniensis]
MAYKGSDAQVRWSDNTFVRWEVVDCIRLKTRTEGNSCCTQDLKSREKTRQMFQEKRDRSQRRKIRKGRADHGPRYRSTQLPLQHLDLTISGGVRLCQPHFIGKEHFVQVDARSQVNSCPHGSISTFHSTMRMTLLPVRSLQSLNLKQTAHLPNEIDPAEAKEEPLVSMMYQVFSACSHHNWCTSSQSSLFDLAILKCLIQRATDNQCDTEYHAADHQPNTTHQHQVTISPHDNQPP